MKTSYLTVQIHPIVEQLNRIEDRAYDCENLHDIVFPPTRPNRAKVILPLQPPGPNFRAALNWILHSFGPKSAGPVRFQFEKPVQHSFLPKRRDLNGIPPLIANCDEGADITAINEQVRQIVAGLQTLTPAVADSPEA